MEPHVIVQEDLDANPLLVTLEASVGDLVAIATPNTATGDAESDTAPVDEVAAGQVEDSSPESEPEAA